MNLKLLETFAQVVEYGSLSRAATSLGVAQSIVSRNIGQLETNWNARLFERNGRGVVLTEFGHTVLPEVRQLLKQQERIEEVVKDAAGVLSGVVRIGVVPSMAKVAVPPLLKHLQAHAPGIRLHIFEGLSGHLDDWLASGRIDMAIINRYVLPLREDELGEMTTYLICPASHKYARLPSIAFKDLAELQFVLPPVPSGLRSILDLHTRRFGIRLDIVMESESLSVMKEVVAAGGAMTILPLCTVQTEVLAGRLAVVKIVDPAIPRKITLATTGHHGLSKAARYVLSNLKSNVSRDLLAPVTAM